MALDRQRILSELTSVVNQLQSADCGCVENLFKSNHPHHQGHPNGYMQQNMNVPSGNTGMCHHNSMVPVEPCQASPHQQVLSQSHPFQVTPCQPTPCQTSPQQHTSSQPACNHASGDRSVHPRCGTSTPVRNYTNPANLYADTYDKFYTHVMTPTIKEIQNEIANHDAPEGNAATTSGHMPNPNAMPSAGLQDNNKDPMAVQMALQNKLTPFTKDGKPRSAFNQQMRHMLITQAQQQAIQEAQQQARQQAPQQTSEQTQQQTLQHQNSNVPSNNQQLNVAKEQILTQCMAQNNPDCLKKHSSVMPANEVQQHASKMQTSPMFESNEIVQQSKCAVPNAYQPHSNPMLNTLGQPVHQMAVSGYANPELHGSSVYREYPPTKYSLHHNTQPAQAVPSSTHSFQGMNNHNEHSARIHQPPVNSQQHTNNSTVGFTHNVPQQLMIPNIAGDGNSPLDMAGQKNDVQQKGNQDMYNESSAMGDRRLVTSSRTNGLQDKHYSSSSFTNGSPCWSFGGHVQRPSSQCSYYHSGH